MLYASPFLIMNFKTSNDPRIDDQATFGLEGVHNSLAYRVHEIEKHLHNSEDWFGLAVTPDAELHRADDIVDYTNANVINPFQIDAGNDNWGSWVQILGSSDTPNRTGMVKFDLHHIQVVASQTTNVEAFIQIAYGASGAAALAAMQYSTIPYLTPTNQAAEGSMPMMMPRVDAGTKVWARLLEEEYWTTVNLGCKFQEGEVLIE